MLTEELDLSGSLIDGAGLEILSKKCTNLFSLVLQRCHQLDRDAQGCLGAGFSGLLKIDLSHNNFVDKQTLKMLLRSGRIWIRLVGWNISMADEAEIMDEFLDILPFVTIFANNGERILEIEDYWLFSKF